jgi:hypothetical protein
MLFETNVRFLPLEELITQIRENIIKESKKMSKSVKEATSM